MSIKKRKFDSIEKMLSFPKYITLDNDTLTLKNCIINFDFSLVNFISTISPQSIVCVSNEQKETEDTGKLYEVNCNITFENVDFLKDVSIIRLVFKGKIELKNIQSSVHFGFSMCFFAYQYITPFNNEQFPIIIDRITHTPLLFFDNCHFNSNMLIMNVYCSFLLICKCEINALIGIVNIHIIKDINQLANDIIKQADSILLDEIHVRGDFKMGKVTNACKMSLRKITIDKDGLLKISNYNDDLKKKTSYKLGNIEFLNSIVNGTIILKDSVFRKFKFDEIDVAGNIIEENINYVDLCNIETANILKKQAQKQSNTYLYNKHKSEELNKLFINKTITPIKDTISKIEYYENKKLFILRTKTIIKSIIHNLYIFFISTLLAFFSKERFLLWINKYSNNYGQDWSRGIIFTLIVSFMFYSLFTYSINKIEFSTDFSQWIFFNPTYWKEVIGYLWLPNLDDFKVLLNDNNVSVWSYSCFIIGKIFIAFGIYQTISAFRKYGK